jgi:hypothetical protein
MYNHFGVPLLKHFTSLPHLTSTPRAVIQKVYGSLLLENPKICMEVFPLGDSVISTNFYLFFISDITITIMSTISHGPSSTGLHSSPAAEPFLILGPTEIW